MVPQITNTATQLHCRAAYRHYRDVGTLVVGAVIALVWLDLFIHAVRP